MWFYESSDNSYVHEFFICNYKYLVAEICVGYKWERFYWVTMARQDLTLSEKFIKS